MKYLENFRNSVLIIEECDYAINRWLEADYVFIPENIKDSLYQEVIKTYKNVYKYKKESS